mgnify:CR=1 FL=1
MKIFYISYIFTVTIYLILCQRKSVPTYLVFPRSVRSLFLTDLISLLSPFSACWYFSFKLTFKSSLSFVTIYWTRLFQWFSQCNFAFKNKLTSFSVTFIFPCIRGNDDDDVANDTEECTSPNIVLCQWKPWGYQRNPMLYTPVHIIPCVNQI